MEKKSHDFFIGRKLESHCYLDYSILLEVSSFDMIENSFYAISICLERSYYGSFCVSACLHTLHK